MKYKIHLSGFKQEEKAKYSKLIKDLDGVFHPNMLTFTNVLVCKTVLCKKYKTAQILRCKILNEEWLKVSIEKEEFQPIDGFKLKIFEGVKVGILGFGCEDYKEMVSFFLVGLMEICGGKKLSFFSFF